MINKPIVLITGASRGIGAEAATLFSSKGYFVIVNYLNNAEAANTVVNDIHQSGGEAVALQGDVSDEDQCIALFNKIDSDYGYLDVLVNNVGILQTQCRLEDISSERFNKIFKTNVLSCFYCCKEAVKRMAFRHGGKGGSIVNVSSGAAKSGSPNEYIDYAASKGAMDTLTRGLALEVANEGIRVNAVRPGMIYTEMHALGGEPNRVDRLKAKIPLQRGGQPQEIAEAIFWLASEQSSYMTGSFIDATGGL